MSRRGSTARLFVAVDPPREVRERLASWARAAAAQQRGELQAHRSPLRLLSADTIHITLCFLGNRPVAELDPIRQALATCEGSAGHLSLGAPLWLPERRPRVLAVEVHDGFGLLRALRSEVTRALEREIELDRGAGRFRAHLTVARLRAGTAPEERALIPTPEIDFAGERLALYRSSLSPDGASYESLLNLPLASGESQKRR